MKDPEQYQTTYPSDHTAGVPAVLIAVALCVVISLIIVICVLMASPNQL